MSNQITNYLQGLATNEPPKSFMQATLSAIQSTNLAVGDHLKFDTILNSRGTKITLDTTTPYTSTSGVASLGRFTLQGGTTYILRNFTAANFSTDATFKLRWADVTTGTKLPLSHNCYINGYGVNTVIIPAILIESIITPNTNIVVELLINNISAGTILSFSNSQFTAVGNNDNSGNIATIEEI